MYKSSFHSVSNKKAKVGATQQQVDNCIEPTTSTDLAASEVDNTAMEMESVVIEPVEMETEPIAMEVEQQEKEHNDATRAGCSMEIRNSDRILDMEENLQRMRQDLGNIPF